MPLPSFLQNLEPQLREIRARLQPLADRMGKRTRIGVVAGLGLFLLLIVVRSCGSDEAPTPVIVPIVKEEPPPAPMPDNDSLILQLFNPSDQSLTHQLSTTVFSQQIEQAMTVSYVLMRCRLITQDDYSRTFQALILYAQQTKLADDPASSEVLVRKLAESASASYTLVYGRTPCDDAQLPTLAAQLGQWVDAIYSR